MKYQVKTTKAFEKDLKRLKKGGKNLAKLQAIITIIISGENLAEKHRLHKLSGDWQGAWECHIEPDWLLIWYVDEDLITFERSGSHANLFR